MKYDATQHIFRNMINSIRENTIMPIRNKFKCVCGYEGNAGHTGRCVKYLNIVEKTVHNMKLYIADYYKTTYSVTDCCNYVIQTENISIQPSSLRRHITTYLDSLGIREKLDSKILNQNRQIKMRATMLKRYGVINAGQMNQAGWHKQNLIPYNRLKINDEYQEFRKKVDYLTRKNLGKIKKEKRLPKHCYYTGMLFNDDLLEKVNPNDPLKRSIDHKVSVTESFFRGWTPDRVANENNLAFCVRIANTVKNQLNENDFRKMLLPMLKKRLENENKIN